MNGDVYLKLGLGNHVVYVNSSIAKVKRSDLYYETKWLLLDDLISENKSRTRVSMLESNWNESALNLTCHFFFLKSHDQWVYIDAINPKPKVEVLKLSL